MFLNRGTCALFLGWAAAVGGQEWTVEEIGEGTKPELALDGEGRPHIAYMTEALSGGVFYAVRGSEGWQVETVAEGYFYGPLDLAVDEQGGAHIVYHDHQGSSFDPDLGDVAYAFRSAAGWLVETVRHPGHDGWDVSIAIGPDGEVHIASIDPVQFDGVDGVEWALRSGSIWRVERIGSGPLPYEFGTALAVDGAGRPHIAYHDGSERLNAAGSGSDLLYAFFDGGSWRIEAVDEQGDVGKFQSLALDGAGRPHLSYFEWSERGAGYAKYAWRGESGWQSERVGPLEEVQIAFLGARRMTSIALDGAGRPHIAYADRNQVYYAVRGDEGWEVQSVVQVAEADLATGQLVSLALDQTGRPHIAFYELPRRPSSSLGLVYYAAGPLPTAVSGEAEPPLPGAFALAEIYPNPFNATALLRYQVPRQAGVELAVYNLAGQRVRQLVSGTHAAGAHQVLWDGTDAQGRPVASGVYLAVLRSGSWQAAGKMALVR